MPNTSFKATFLTACMLTTSMISTNALAQDPELAFYAKTKWVVEKVGADNSNAAPVCTISNKLNNGYVVQLAGTENGFTNINLDLRQDIFQKNTSYDVEYEVPGIATAAVSTKAFNGNLLVSDLRNEKDFAQKLTSATVLDVNINDNKFRMYLTGLEAGMKSFNECASTSAPSFAAKEDIKDNTETAAITSPEATETSAENLTPDTIESTEIIAASDIITESDQVAAAPSVTHEKMSSPEPIQTYTRNEEPIIADFTQEVAEMELAEAEIFAQIEPVAGVPEINEIATTIIPDAENKLTALRQEIAALTTQNKALDQDLKHALSESKAEGVSVSSNNWNLEKATMKFNESERQIMRLGRKLQSQKAQCQAEKASLETMLFDPELTNQQQLVTLTSLETELDAAKTDLFRQQRQYEERIKLLEQQLNAQ